MSSDSNILQIVTRKSTTKKNCIMEDPDKHTKIEQTDNWENTSVYYRLQTSHSSSISSEADLSFSLANERELERIGDCDELPAFEIRLLSPLGRSPSPIDNDSYADIETQTGNRLIASPCFNESDFVALHDINAQISPPSDDASSKDPIADADVSLETIFEGVFLQTPPRARSARNTPNSQQQKNRTRSNFLEKVALNRLQAGKENQSPKERNLSPCRSPNTSAYDNRGINNNGKSFKDPDLI